jgi:hypothetical protein
MEIKKLYHASHNRNIEVLEPRAETIRDPSEGPVVFASHDKQSVTCFLVPTDDSWAKISQYRGDKHPTIYVMCISDEKRFRELDKGGAIYHLSPKSFYLDESKSRTEWTSKESVMPINKELYNSGLDAMIDNGVLVYFCDEPTLLELKKNPWDVERAMGILKSLVSENEKRGLENIIHKYY